MYKTNKTRNVISEHHFSQFETVSFKTEPQHPIMKSPKLGESPKNDKLCNGGNNNNNNIGKIN